MENQFAESQSLSYTNQAVTTVLRATNVSKVFNTGGIPVRALSKITFDINKGEFIALMGKSGAGKSTLLYQLSALDTPTTGEIIIGNLNVVGLSPTDLQEFRLETLGYVFQDYALIPEMTVLANVSFPLRMRGLSLKDAEVVAHEALRKVGLEGKSKKYPSQLSGGEQQRVSVARAVAGNPTILFADEPTANLDTTSARTVIRLFQELNAQGITIVMVTHEEEYARACSRLITLEDGMIINDERRKKEEMVIF
jgi:putative ABC transport system ATP-binding protein